MIVLIIPFIAPVRALPETEGPPDTPTVAAKADARPEDAAARLFQNKCASCHSVGGRAIGDSPDLLPSTQWAREDLKTAIVRMQKNVGPMSDDEVDTLADLLKSPDVRKRLEAERQRREAQPERELEPASAARGEALFIGTEALSAGGMACSSCHKAGASGGTLARDLTHVFDRLGETPLRSAIVGANFPVMRPAYAKKPVTAQEAAHITKYLEGVHAGAPDRAADPPAAASARLFGWAGLFLAGGGIVGLGLGLRWRDRDGTRARLVRDSTRSRRS